MRAARCGANHRQEIPMTYFSRHLRALAAASCIAVALCATAPAQAQSLDTRTLYANSHCQHPIRLMVHHKDSTNPHHAHGWYEFRAYQENRLQANNVVLRQVVGEPLYVYAETVGGPGVPLQVWGGTDATVSFAGVNYGMRRVGLTVNTRGELEFGFSCS
jgi:hypothetical protein